MLVCTIGLSVFFLLASAVVCGLALWLYKFLRRT